MPTCNGFNVVLFVDFDLKLLKLKSMAACFSRSVFSSPNRPTVARLIYPKGLSRLWSLLT
jgi:hypothetical protein